MFGVVRVADIPKMIVGFVVGVVLLFAFFGLLMAFPNLIHRLPESVFIGIFLLILWASFASGEYLWERIRDRF